jgi:prepilin-type N-terminal cleavage/methylation domain-containing protein
MHMLAPRRAPRTRGGNAVRGFTLLELLLVVAVLTTVGAMAVPAISNSLDGMRVGMSAREVERELQSARLKAVSTNKPMRVRFNCPVAGQFRRVELIGTPGSPNANDGDAQAATRCSDTSAYQYPDLNQGVFDVPNHDGPLKRLDPTVTFGTARTLEFWPDGTVHADTGSGNPWPVIPDDAPVTITLQKAVGSSAAIAASLKTIEVNGVGKIQLR